MTVDPDRLRELSSPEPDHAWTRDREDAVWARLNATPNAAPRVPRFALIATAAAAIVVAFLVGSRWSPPADDGRSEPVAAVSAGMQPLQFRDGTSVTPLNERTEVVVASATSTLTEVQLRRGAARFDVTPDRDRTVRVNAGLVTVEVLGTEFDCERDGDRVEVRVLRGRVKVSWPQGSRTLSQGESGTFPPSTPTPRVDAEPPIDAAPQGDPTPDATADEPVKPPAKPAKPSAKPKQRRSAETLMQAADEARKAGDSATAIARLEQVLRDHPQDPRADVAAFTIGRIEMSRGRFRVAARYFARVRQSARRSLAEHALAREAEAWRGAGEPGKARDRARTYLAKYPDGPRAEQVRRIAEAAGD